MEPKETLETILQRQADTAREAMNRAFVRYGKYHRDSPQGKKAVADMDMWENRMNDAQYHLDKLKGDESNPNPEHSDAITALERLADAYEESGKQLSQAVGAIADKLAEINAPQ